jgi:hypothetical protein
MYAAIIISVVVHVVAIVWTVAADSRAPMCAVAIAEPELEVLEVQWLGVVEVAQNVKLAAPPDGERPATTLRRVRPGRISTAPSTVGTESAVEPAKVGGERSKLMTMRHPRQAPAATLGVSGEFLDEFLRRSKPVPDPPDLPGARIDAEIAEIRARMRNRNEGYDPTSDREALVGLRAARKQVELELQKDGTYEADKPTFVAKVDRDGKLHFHDKPNLQPEGLGALRLNDAVMRSLPWIRMRARSCDSWIARAISELRSAGSTAARCCRSRAS